MSRERKITVEEKIKYVQQWLSGGIGINEASRQAGVDPKAVRNWINRYETEGIEGFLCPKGNRVYSPEEKQHAVEEYLAGGKSQEDICKKYKIRSDSQLRRWIKVYTDHGDFNSVKFSGGGSYMKQGRETTQAERIQIAKECIASGKNYGEMALKYQVSYQQVRTWTLRYEELGEPGLEDRRGKCKQHQTARTELEEAQIKIKELEHKLYLAEMENALLKKLDETARRDAYPK